MKKRALAVAAAVSALATNAFAEGNLTVPAVDLSDFYVGVGVVLTAVAGIYVANKVKGFIR